MVGHLGDRGFVNVFGLKKCTDVRTFVFLINGRRLIMAAALEALAVAAENEDNAEQKILE